MSRYAIIALAGSFLLIGAAVLFLVTWNIPAPVTEVQKVLPDDRFPR